jgi:hypothetical protein
MGYSLTAKANDRLNMIMEHNGDESSNTWFDDKGNRYFYEIGRENPDGAFTGSVWKFITEGEYAGRAKKSGSIRIGPNGEVTRFPNMNKAMKAAAKKPLPKAAMFQVI